MCESYSGNMLQRPVVASDLEIITGHYGGKHQVLASEMFGAMTDDLFVPVPVFVTIFDLVVRHTDNLDRGVGTSAFGPHIRFSALVPGTLNRFQSREMSLIHDGISTFNMAERNRIALNNVLRSHGLQIVMDCCCGTNAVPTQLVSQYMESAEYRNGNRLRTLADSYGSLDQVASVDMIPDNLLPQSEKDAFRRIVAVSRDVVTRNKIMPSTLIDQYLPAEQGQRADRVPQSIHT